MLKKYVQLVLNACKLLMAYLLTLFDGRAPTNFLVASNYGDRAIDGIALFEHIQDLGHPVCYIVDNPDETGDEIKRGSLHSIICYFKSTAVFYTHSFSDVIPHAHRIPFLVNLFRGPKKIFIQHGVIGLKAEIAKGRMLSDYVLNENKIFDKMVVSSKLEFNIVKEMGVEEHKLFDTGLSRFDLLAETSSNLRILVFFTWSKEAINNPNSDYFERISRLEKSGVLDILRKASFTISFIRHPMMLGSDPQTSDGREILNEINRSSLLITDNSSIAWDFFYKNNEIIFFLPNKNSYIMDHAEISARIASDEVELTRLVKKLLEQGFTSNFNFATHKDKINCDRIFKLSLP